MGAQSSYATPICEFSTPTDGGFRAGFALYHCRGGISCRRVTYTGGIDLYAADTDEGHICGLALTAAAQTPFYYRIAGIGNPPILLTVRGHAVRSMWSTPFGCHFGLCLRSGVVSVLAYHPLALPRVHVRPWLFTLAYV